MLFNKKFNKKGITPSLPDFSIQIFLYIFNIIGVGMLIIGGIGIKYGKYQRLIYGTDYKGQICGVDTEVEDKIYIAYPRTNEDFLANLGKSSPLDYKFYGICVKSCPQTLDVVCHYKLFDETVYTKSVKQSCISDSSYNPGNSIDCNKVRNNCWLIPQETSSMLYRCIPNYNISGGQSSYCVYPPSITDALDPRCIIVQDDKVGSVQRPAKPNMLFDQLNTGRQVWARWFGDLARSWWVILVCAIGVALVCGFFWVTLLKYCTGFMVWTTIWLVILLLSFLTGFFYYKAGLVRLDSVSSSSLISPSLNDQLAQLQSTTSSLMTTASSTIPQSWKDNTAQYQTSYEAVAYVSTGVLILVLCILIALRKSIRMAIDVLKIGSNALKELPSLLFFPVTNVICIGIFLIWWIFVAACLQSAATVTNADLQSDIDSGLKALSTATGVAVPANVSAALLHSLGTVNMTFTVLEDMPVMNYLMIYHVFGLLWTAQFIQGIATMTVAGAVCAWYFNKLPKEMENDPEMVKLQYPRSRFTILSSLWRTLRYYLGSVAFGSLLIAIIQFIRLVFLYIQKKLEPQAKKNSQLKFILCCIQCCLKCLQSLVETVSRNAYIFIALKGNSFCASGGMVFKLLFNHGSVFAAVNILGEIIMFLGKITISVISAWVAYILLDRLPQFQPNGSSPLSSTWLPILVTLFFAYVTASGFMMIFDLSVDSVLVCYCTDIDENMQRNGGNSKYKVAIHMHVDKLTVKAHKDKEEKSKKEVEVDTVTNVTAIPDASKPAAAVSPRM